MSLNSVSSVVSAVAAQSATSAQSAKKESKSDSTASSKNFSDTAAVYEKSSDSTSSKDSVKKNNSADRSAIVQALKDDAEQRKQQLIEIVRKSMSGQASTWNKSQGLKSLFENLTVDADTIAQAKKDIADDGYWGVNQTSDRILDFAKALSGGDASKADELLEAFKKGYKKATGAWGDELPSICKDTYDAVVKKFDEWKNGTQTDSTQA
ncbi:hypothetical protein [Agathobacter sp.]